MHKKHLALLILTAFITLPALAEGSIFSNSDSEQFNLQPLNHTQSVSAPSKVAPASSLTTSGVKAAAGGSELANKNYKSAISNLDNVEIELREQMASYSALMAQAKTNYESRKDEYNQYKKEYNALKKKMNKIEKSKKIIQSNIDESLKY